MSHTTVQKIEELSVFFPLYNEEKNVALLVEEAMKVIPTVAHTFEILLINDGSTDNTAKIARDMMKKYPRVRLVSQKNAGYGGAVKRGFAESKYSWVFFSDGDLQFDLSELKKFIPYTQKNDLIIGYRMTRADGKKRAFIARMLKIWNRVFLGFPSFVKDIDCAFKLIRKEVIVTAAPLLSDGAMLTTEFLLKAYKAGYSFKQIPVHHYERKFGTSTGDDPKVIYKAVRDTYLLRKNLTSFAVKQKMVLFFNSLPLNRLNLTRYTA